MFSPSRVQFGVDFAEFVSTAFAEKRCECFWNFKSIFQSTQKGGTLKKTGDIYDVLHQTVSVSWNLYAFLRQFSETIFWRKERQKKIYILRGDKNNGCFARPLRPLKTSEITRWYIISRWYNMTLVMLFSWYYTQVLRLPCDAAGSPPAAPV